LPSSLDPRLLRKPYRYKTVNEFFDGIKLFLRDIKDDLSKYESVLINQKSTNSSELEVLSGSDDTDAEIDSHSSL